MVPSICHETQGIVIQEAFAAGVPALVSEGTSLTESVVPGENGLYFRRGSARDLERQIRRLLDDPALLPRLRAGIPAVRTIEEDVEYFCGLYGALVNRR